MPGADLSAQVMELREKLAEGQAEELRLKAELERVDTEAQAEKLRSALSAELEGFGALRPDLLVKIAEARNMVAAGEDGEPVGQLESGQRVELADVAHELRRQVPELFSRGGAAARAPGGRILDAYETMGAELGALR
jgi:hypothetical protein